VYGIGNHNDYSKELNYREMRKEKAAYLIIILGVKII
jgi:hypothetical protein